MPVDPAGFPAGAPVTAKALNTALYTYSPGDNFTASGILFHAQRPLLAESMTTAMTQGSSATGTFTSLNGAGKWTSWYDNGVLLGGPSDFQANFATGQLKPAVPGAGGAAGQVGGYYLVWGFPGFSATANANCSGAALSENGTQVGGGKQLSSTAHNNCSYVLDLVEVTGANQPVFMQGFCADASGSGFTYAVNAADYSGSTPRFYGVWACALTGSTVASVPSPPAWSGTSAVTSAALNGAAVGDPLKLLNYPPVLRASGTLTTSIAANTQTKVALDTADIDSYGGFSAASNAYTVPLPGVYVAHGFSYYNSSSSGLMMTGISVNGNTPVYGPCYSAPSANNCGPQVTVLLDLNAGDTVTLETFSTVTQSLGSGFPQRLVLAWMGAQAASSGSVSWTPPGTGFRWQAGTPGAALAGQFQSHLTGDVSFLLQRPYLMAHQTVAQAGLAQDAYHVITMDSVAGFAHGTAGDNYGGWTPGASNLYTAQVPGWYMVLARYKQAPVTTLSSLVAAVAQAPAGLSSPDVYQHISAGASGTLAPGAEAAGLYYLRAGDTVQPQYQQQDGSATFSTSVSAGNQSSFGLIWLCE